MGGKEAALIAASAEGVPGGGTHMGAEGGCIQGPGFASYLHYLLAGDPQEPEKLVHPCTSISHTLP